MGRTKKRETNQFDEQWLLYYMCIFSKLTIVIISEYKKNKMCEQETAWQGLHLVVVQCFCLFSSNVLRCKLSMLLLNLEKLK